MKEKAKNIFLLLLVLMFIGYLLVTAILDLTNRKHLYSVHGDRGMEIMEVEHAINGLIPVGKEHFYLLMDSATGQACIVNGSASWFRKNFGADGRALDPAGVNVTSLAKKGDFEVSEELINRVSGMEGLLEAAVYPKADIVLTAVVGMIGIRPTIAALEAGKDIALANKETLVTAGHLIIPLAKEKGATVPQIALAWCLSQDLCIFPVCISFIGFITALCPPSITTCTACCNLELSDCQTDKGSRIQHLYKSSRGFHFRSIN